MDSFYQIYLFRQLDNSQDRSLFKFNKRLDLYNPLGTIAEFPHEVVECACQACLVAAHFLGPGRISLAAETLQQFQHIVAGLLPEIGDDHLSV